MDHREPNSLKGLIEWDRAVENAQKSILASEELLAHVREVAHSVDERIHRVLDDHADRSPFE